MGMSLSPPPLARPRGVCFIFMGLIEIKGLHKQPPYDSGVEDNNANNSIPIDMLERANAENQEIILKN